MFPTASRGIFKINLTKDKPAVGSERSAASSLGHRFSRGMWSKGESPEEHEGERRIRKCHRQRPKVIKPKEEGSATVFKYGKRLLQRGRERSVPFVLGK